MICGCFFTNSKTTYADLKITEIEEEVKFQRSLESLRDFDYQTWQLIVYQSPNTPKNLILRIVAYPGSLRFDHPTDLLVSSGIKNWHLRDITTRSNDQIGVLNDSAAEFDLKPLVDELDKNRPLIISLPGVINDLVVPPYLVSEWRKLFNNG